LAVIFWISSFLFLGLIFTALLLYLFLYSRYVQSGGKNSFVDFWKESENPPSKSFAECAVKELPPRLPLSFLHF
jgi:hypothetical protein